MARGAGGGTELPRFGDRVEAGDAAAATPDADDAVPDDAIEQLTALRAEKPSQDVQPLSAFRADAAGFLAQVRATKRPLILTQHGKSAAVLLDVDQYEALLDELELIRDIRQAKAELARGGAHPHEEVVSELRKRLDR